MHGRNVITSAELMAARVLALRQPTSAAALERLATLAYDAGAIAACRSLAWRAVMIAPSKRSLDLIASADSQLASQPIRCLPAFQRTLCFFPDDPRHLLAITQIHTRAEQTNRARRSGRIATRLRPGYDLAWFELAKLTFNNTDYLAAERMAQRSLLIRPSLSKALLILSKSRLRRHGLQTSLRPQKQSVLLNPHDRSAWQNLLLSADKAEDADLQGWLERHCPRDIQQKDAMSIVRAIAANPDSAKGLRAAAPHYCHDPLAVAQAAGFLLDSGRFNIAEQIFRQALAVDPDMSQALAGMLRLSLLRQTGPLPILRWLRRCLLNQKQGPTRALWAFSAKTAPETLIGAIEKLLQLANVLGDQWLARTAIHIAVRCKHIPAASLIDSLGKKTLDSALGDRAELYVRENLMVTRRMSGEIETRLTTTVRKLRNNAPSPAGEARTLSIVIPTGNRLADLKSMLSSVMAQTSTQLEIIFSVFADQQGTGAFLERSVSEDARCSIVEEKAAHFSKVRAIENGIAKASGDLVLMLDCDCELLRTDTHEQILRLIRIYPANIYSIDYRGMILLHRHEFDECNILSDRIVDGQVSLDTRVNRSGIGSDDIVWICEHLANRRSSYALIARSRTERVSLSYDGQLTLALEPPLQDVPRLIHHAGEYRIVSRQDIHAADHASSTKDELIAEINDSFGFEPYITQIRRYLSKRTRIVS